MVQVSVIIPTYNRADMIGDAIRSVLDQTYGNWELIVVDDGSTDDTRAVVAGFNDPRTHYVFQQNRGLPAARNTGIRAAQGIYIAFLDSDDCFLPQKLAWQVAALDAEPDTGLVASGYIETDAMLQPLREVASWHAHPELSTPQWLQTCPFISSSVLVRRAWLERVGLFDEDMRYIEDWDLWLRLAHAGCRMRWVERIVSCYRFHGSNMVRDTTRMRDGMIRMLDKFYAQTALPDELLALRDRAYASIHLSAAARAYAAQDWQTGKESLGRALQFDSRLLEGIPPSFLSSLASSALSPAVDDGSVFMAGVAANLPEMKSLRRWSRREALGVYRGVTAFDRYSRGQYGPAFVNGVRALLSYRGWWRQRGLLSITLRSLLAMIGRRQKPDQGTDAGLQPCRGR